MTSAQTAPRDVCTAQSTPILRPVPLKHPAAMLFNRISAITCDAHGALIVADGGDNRIYKLLPNGKVRIIAGGKRGYADGKDANAEFLNIVDIAMNAEGEILVLDEQRIRKICANGIVTTLAGFPLRGKSDGQGADARFNMPLAIAVTSEDGCVFVADAGNQCLRVIQPDGRVQTLPFFYGMPSALCVDNKGRLLVLDRVRGAVHRITKLIDTDVQGACEYADSVLVQFPPATPLINVTAMICTNAGELLLLDGNGSFVKKIQSNASSSVIWCGVQEQFMANDVLVTKNGEIIIANARTGILHKLVGANITGRFLQNMTHSQFSMTVSQFFMTKKMQFFDK